MPRKKRISLPNEIIIEVMGQTDESIPVAAEALNVSESSLRKRISSDRQLRSLYIKDSPVPIPLPDAVDTLIREPKPAPEDGRLADAIQKMNAQLLNEGLRQAGISEATCNKLEIFSKMDENGWRMLVGGLDLMHRMLLYQAAALFQEAERGREELDSDDMDWDQRVTTQKHYNEICKTLISTYDRVLNGTLASVKMAQTAAPSKKRKPGFAPLTEKETHQAN
jgi:hypothetical protein